MKFNYLINDDRVCITKYLGDEEEVVVPREIDGFPVVAIGDFAFRGAKQIESIRIPDSVLSIGKEAFCDCENLQMISLPHSIVSIGANAFYKCKNLETIIIPDNVTVLSYGLFKM